MVPPVGGGELTAAEDLEPSIREITPRGQAAITPVLGRSELTGSVPGPRMRRSTQLLMIFLLYAPQLATSCSTNLTTSSPAPATSCSTNLTTSSPATTWSTPRPASRIVNTTESMRAVMEHQRRLQDQAKRKRQRPVIPPEPDSDSEADRPLRQRKAPQTKAKPVIPPESDSDSDSDSEDDLPLTQRKAAASIQPAMTTSGFWWVRDNKARKPRWACEICGFNDTSHAVVAAHEARCQQAKLTKISATKIVKPAEPARAAIVPAAPVRAAIVSSQQRAPVPATAPVAAVHQAALAHPELHIKLSPSTKVLKSVAKRAEKYPDGKVIVAYTELSAIVQRAADEGAEKLREVQLAKQRQYQETYRRNKKSSSIYLLSAPSPIATIVLLSLFLAIVWLFRSRWHRDAEDSALMMAGDEDANDWDARKYPKCKPFLGKKGVQFDKFVQDFGASMAMDGDDDNDLEETMLGNDIGGDNYAGAAPNGPQTRRRNRRLKLLFGHLYRHVTDLRLREMMHAQARNDGRAAFRMLELHCRRDITDLEMFDLNAEWEAATFITAVGLSLDTVTMFTRYINGLNARRPAAERKDDNALTLKFLSCFTPAINMALSLDAHKELRAAPAARSFHDATTGQRDFAGAVQAFDELWRSQFSAGAIKPMPRRAASGPSVRVDGAAVAGLDDNEDDDSGLVTFNKARTITDAELREEPNCWQCRGFGHRKTECPSAPGFRPISACVSILQTSANRAERRQPSKGGRGKGGGARNLRGGGRGRFAGSGLYTEDGFVFSADGVCIGSLADEEEDQAQDDQTQEAPSTDNGIVVEDWEEDEGLVVTEDEALVTSSDDITDLSDEYFDRQVKSMLESGYPLATAISFAITCKKLDKKSSAASNACSAKVNTESVHTKQPTTILMMLFSLFNRIRRSVPWLLVMVMVAMPFATPLMQERNIHLESALTLNGNSLFAKNAGALDLIIDSGATKHCVSDISQLDTVTDSRPKHGGVRVGNGKKLPVAAVGTMKVKVNTLQLHRRKKKLSTIPAVETMNLSNVLVVPGMPCRLFSTKWAYEHDQIATHLNGDAHLRLPSGSKVPFKNDSNHYVVEGALAANASDDDSDLTHARLGHFSVARINGTLGHTHKISPGHCEACSLNAPKKPRPRSTQQPIVYTHFGQRVASDTCGPFPPSPQGYTYAVNFVDLFSRYSATYFVKSQDSAEILLALQTFVADHKSWLLNTKLPGVVDEWYTDNGTEFLSGDIDAFCCELGTRRAMSVPYVPTRNPNAERLWGILLGPMRKMLAHSGGGDSVKDRFWPWLMMQATSLHNSLHTRSHDPPCSPLEKLEVGPVKLDHYRVMLCDCYVSLPKPEELDKLANRRIKAVHLGWDARRHGYFVFIPELNRITTVIDIDFLEHSFSSLGVATPPERETSRKRPEQRNLPVPVNRDQLPSPPAPAPAPSAPLVPTAPAPEPVVPVVRLVQRGGAVPSGSPGPDVSAFADADAVLLASLPQPVPFTHASVGELYLATDPAVSGPIPIPRSAKEALADPIFGKRWKEAMIEEIKGKYETNEAWEYVDKLPPGRKAMKGKWVFKVEYNGDGSVKRFKARWVACGYTQVPGVDFNETYASTLRAESLRIFLASAAACDDDLYEADVVKAFTLGTLDVDDLYVEQPHEFADPTKVACRLLKPLEGTRQGAHLFSVANAEEMTKQDFTRSKTEPNIFWKTIGDTTLKVGVYVDNLLMAHPRTDAGKKMRIDFMTHYKKRFNTEERGIPTKFMGIEINRRRDDKTITISQEQYIGESCDKFLSSTCTKTFQSPVHSSKLDEFMKISTAKDDLERAAMRDKPYLSLMGTLLWCVFTHPEVAYYVSFLCQFMHDPSPEGYEAGLGVLAYLNSSRKLGITYDGNKPYVSVFTDSSWSQTPFPFGGHAIFFCGAAVSYQARKLKIVPQSSAEAELAVYATAAKDLQFVLNLLGPDGMKITISIPVSIYCDNQAAVSNVKNVGATARTRHYENWLMYGREQYLNQISTPSWIETVNQVADIFTKALDKTTFLKFRAVLLNVHAESVSTHLRNLTHGGD